MPCQQLQQLACAPFEGLLRGRAFPGPLHSWLSVAVSRWAVSVEPRC